MIDDRCFEAYRHTELQIYTHNSRIAFASEKNWKKKQYKQILLWSPQRLQN